MVNVPLLCSGDREIGFHRGWPETDASRLRTPDLSVVRDPAPLFGSWLGYVVLGSADRFRAPWLLDGLASLYGSPLSPSSNPRASYHAVRRRSARGRGGRSTGYARRRRDPRPDRG